MRGLPPYPDDFFLLHLELAANAARMSIGFNYFAPGAGAATPSQLSDFISQWATSCMPELLAIMPSDASFITCRLRAVGSAPSEVVQQFPGNAGAFGSSAIAAGNLCLTWRTAEHYKGARAQTHLPLTGDLVSADRGSLQASYWAEASGHANAFVAASNAVVSPDGGLCVLATVHRSRGGQALSASEWAPVLSGNASTRVGTLRRRVPKNSRFPPF